MKKQKPKISEDVLTLPNKNVLSMQSDKRGLICESHCSGEVELLKKDFWHLFALVTKSILKERETNILVDRAINGKTLREIAKSYKITPERARQIYFRACMKLRLRRESKKLEWYLTELSAKDYEDKNVKLKEFDDYQTLLSLGIAFIPENNI